MDCFEFRACLAGRCLCSQNSNEYSNKPAKGIILRRSGYFFKYIPPNKFVPFHKCWAQFSHYDRWGRQIPCRVIFLPRPLLFFVNHLRFRIRQHFRLPRTLDCRLGDSTGPHYIPAAPDAHSMESHHHRHQLKWMEHSVRLYIIFPSICKMYVGILDLFLETPSSATRSLLLLGSGVLKTF